MPEFAFDVVLTAALRVEAATEKQARKILRDHLDSASANLGAWPDGQPILCEVSLATGEQAPDLYEIDGEEPHFRNFTAVGESLFADGDLFRIFEDPARGWRVVRLADGEQAIFQGDDQCERFRDHFTGDELGADDPAELSDEADEFGAWCVANGEINSSAAEA